MIIYQNIIDNTQIIGMSSMRSQLHNHPDYPCHKKFMFTVFLTNYPVEIETPFLDTKDVKEKEEFIHFRSEFIKAKEVIEALINKQPLERKRVPKQKTKESITN